MKILKEMVKVENSLLEEIYVDDCFKLSKADSVERHKAFNKFETFGLIEQQGKSYRLTIEGNKAYSLGGFNKWQARKGKLYRIYLIVGIIGVAVATLAIFYDRIFPITELALLV